MPGLTCDVCCPVAVESGLGGESSPKAMPTKSPVSEPCKTGGSIAKTKALSARFATRHNI
jgi:hypothetical protein